MQDDDRCCGTGTCIIDAQGCCWCGQQWDGEKMCRPEACRVGTFADETLPSADAESPLSAMTTLPTKQSPPSHPVLLVV